MSQKSSVEINSKVNELFIKTIVTQKLLNSSDNPLELKIFIDFNPLVLFSSFSAKIGDSITVHSKVIKQSIAEKKYTDSIASGNAAIFVSKNETEDLIIINMGNIPPKQEVIFTSEFIQFIECSEFYEFELFRDLPIFCGKDTLFSNSEVKGTVEINTKSKIKKVEKNILSEDKLNIIEEKFLDENKCDYLIKYEYKNLPQLTLNDYEEYIPSNKIFFEKENNAPCAFYQKSLIKENEINYVIQYKNISKDLNNENKGNILNPSLFIFLLDQSGSMSGYSMEVACKALILFLQSLPAGSYYQIIGFGSDYEKYDKSPKQYTQKNIKESIKLIETLKANRGGTVIYGPLEDIYKSKKDYNKIKLPKNIFLLTDGEIYDKSQTLNIIEKNSNEFFVFAIGIGKDFDRDLIKNAGVLGKGNYDFCSDIKDLNKVIVKGITNCSKPFLHDFEFKTNFDDNNLYKANNIIDILKENQIVNIKYIVENKEGLDTNLKLNLKYNLFNKRNKKNEEINENYEINSEEIQAGEELSKLIIYDYLFNKNGLTFEEKIKLALKYQILTEYTSLFAEVELSEKISEKMRQEIIGDGKNKVINDREINKYKNDLLVINNNVGVGSSLNDDLKEEMLESIINDVKKGNQMLMDLNRELKHQGAAIEMVGSSPEFYKGSKRKSPSKLSGIGNFFKSMGNSIKGFFSKKESDNDNDVDNNENKIEENINDNEIKEDEFVNEIKTNNDDNKEINIKDVINEQNFVEGYWELSKNTKKIKEKYENEFKLLKELKDKNITDNVAITILIIYLINKEHSELLSELFMIIEKAKNYIVKNTKDSYENIIKEIRL